MRKSNRRLTNIGKLLRDMTSAYGISNARISANGGPDATTLSRVSRIPNTHLKDTTIKKIALGFYAAVKASTGQEHPGLEESVYERIKHGLGTNPNRPLLGTGKVLRDLQDEYNISGFQISANGGPDTTTLSRINRGRNMPTRETSRVNVATRIARGFYEAVKLSTGQEHPELEKIVYDQIKQALDTDTNTLSAVPAPQITPQESDQSVMPTDIETLISFYKRDDRLKPTFLRIGGGYDLLVDKRASTVFLRTREEEGPRKMLVLEQAEFQLHLLDSDRTLLYVVIGLTYTRLLAALTEMESKLPYPLWHIALK